LDITASLIVGLSLGVAVWLALFILQGIGLYVMAKNRGIEKRMLAFVPFANIWLMGKMAGTCDIFGHPIKRAGLYTMLLQIFITVFSALCVVAEMYLYIVHGLPQNSGALEPPYWGLSGFGGFVEEFYGLSSFLYSIPELVYQIFMMVLLMGLLKQYTPANYTGLGLLSLFIPESRFISIFVLRNRKAINFEDYMRARREEYIRQRQQYQNQYGNPYGNPYGYGGAHTTGTPYNTPQNEPPTPPEEPFAEFGTENTKNDDAPSNGNANDGEDFFN
jgi:hypothetical protein